MLITNDFSCQSRTLHSTCIGLYQLMSQLCCNNQILFLVSCHTKICNEIDGRDVFAIFFLNMIFPVTFYSKSGKKRSVCRQQMFYAVSDEIRRKCHVSQKRRSTYDPFGFFCSCPNAIVNRNYSLLPGKCLAISPREGSTCDCRVTGAVEQSSSIRSHRVYWFRGSRKFP